MSASPGRPRNGIPVHEYQLGGQPVFFALTGEAVDEYLCTNKLITAVIIIARSGDDGEIGRRAKG